MTTPLQQCKSLLLKLTKDERVELKAWIEGLNSGTVSAGKRDKTSSLLDPDDWLIHAIGRLAIKRGFVSKEEVNLELASALRKVPSYQREGRDARQWLMHHLGRAKLSELEKVWVGDFAIDALLNHLHWMNGMDTIKLVEQVHLIPRAIDDEMPGYVASGLLHLILPR